MLTTIIALVVCVAVGGFMGWMGFLIIRAKAQARAAERKYEEIVNKNPLELDLELATTTQILEELRRRPAPQYILLLPQFEPHGINLNIEVHNLPPHIALGLLKMGHKLASRQQGHEVIRQSDEFFNEDSEEGE